jgi:hypothetical protein
LVDELLFNDAIRNANKVWQLIKENGKEDETKRICRDVLAEIKIKINQMKLEEEKHYFHHSNNMLLQTSSSVIMQLRYLSKLKNVTKFKPSEKNT